MKFHETVFMTLCFMKKQTFRQMFMNYMNFHEIFLINLSFMKCHEIRFRQGKHVFECSHLLNRQSSDPSSFNIQHRA
jgi:hypothetical protein